MSTEPTNARPVPDRDYIFKMVTGIIQSSTRYPASLMEPSSKIKDIGVVGSQRTRVLNEFNRIIEVFGGYPLYDRDIENATYVNDLVDLLEERMRRPKSSVSPC